jgi:hypothetical protein
LTSSATTLEQKSKTEVGNGGEMKHLASDDVKGRRPSRHGGGPQEMRQLAQGPEIETKEATKGKLTYVL